MSDLLGRLAKKTRRRPIHGGPNRGGLFDAYAAGRNATIESPFSLLAFIGRVIQQVCNGACLDPRLYRDAYPVDEEEEGRLLEASVIMAEKVKEEEVEDEKPVEQEKHQQESTLQLEQQQQSTGEAAQQAAAAARGAAGDAAGVAAGAGVAGVTAGGAAGAAAAAGGVPGCFVSR
eukprot:6172947-Pleurochrysis_carterae.AAC.1